MALSSTAAICNYSVPPLSSTNNITPSSLPPVDVASVGTVAIPERRSTSINIPNTLANLEAYLHLVDGCAGPTEEEGVFRRGARRDVALVNKTSGMLRAELRIPPSWDQVANKGMVCNEYGRWVKPTREAEDIPSPYQREASATACPSPI